MGCAALRHAHHACGTRVGEERRFASRRIWNPLIAHPFQSYADRRARVEEIKRHTCDFFAARSGGPDDYRGRSMAEAHRRMEIGGAEYAAAADDILNTTKTLTYDAETRAEVAAILRSLKPEITYA